MNQNTATVGVVIPVRNEEASIALVLQDIPADINALVVVVDNGSTDATARNAQESGAVVLHEQIPGYGRVMSKGIGYFKDQPVDIVVFLDGDYSDYPQEMVKLIEPINNNGYDMVVSTRLDPLYDKNSLPFHVVWGNKLVVFLMNLLFRTTYTDLGPFRAIRYDRLIQLHMEDPNYGWTVEMQAKAKLMGLKVKEFPVHYRERIGQSKISGTIKGSVLAGSKMLYTLLKLRLTPADNMRLGRPD
jgi:glycosyltransferase involved in cell wall biosynthesis